jgi:hypothetical protein
LTSDSEILRWPFSGVSRISTNLEDILSRSEPSKLGLSWLQTILLDFVRYERNVF